MGGESFRLHLLDIEEYWVGGHRYTTFSINLALLFGGPGGWTGDAGILTLMDGGRQYNCAKVLLSKSELSFPKAGTQLIK